MLLKVWLGDDAAGDTRVITKKDDSPVNDKSDVFLKRVCVCVSVKGAEKTVETCDRREDSWTILWLSPSPLWRVDFERKVYF